MSPASCRDLLFVLAVPLSCPFVLRVYHYPNSTAYTDTLEQAGRDGPFLWFRGEGASTMDEGKGADGRMHRPIVRWDADRSSFVGPSKMTYKGKSLYEIEMTASEGFEAVDHGGR